MSVKPDLTIELTAEQIEILQPLIDRLYQAQAKAEELESIVAGVYVRSNGRVQLLVKYLDHKTAVNVKRALNGKATNGR